MTSPIRALLSLGALLTVTLWANAAWAQVRTWGAVGLYGEIVVVDCMDCGDDLGLSLSCQGEGSAAAMRVPFAAVEQRPADATAPISFDLDDKGFTFEAEAEEQGLVGFVPLFQLQPNDPLVAALQSSGKARISYQGREVTIGLRGSRSALEIFKAHCGWNNIDNVPTPLIKPLIVVDVPSPKPFVVVAPQPVVTPTPMIDGPQWFTNRFDDASMGGAMISLSYGVPETDDIVFSSDCAIGTGARSASIDLLIDFGGAAPGEAVDAVITTQGQTFGYAGTVFEDSSEFAGIRIEVGARAPLWKALKGGGEVQFGVTGVGLVTVTSAGATAAVEAFTDGCFGAAAPARPLVDLGLKPAISAPQPEPLVKLNLGSTTPATPAASALPPTALTYACDDGSAFKMAIITGVAGNLAMVELPGRAALSLNSVPAPFGTKFSDGTVSVAMGGSASVQLSQPSGRQICQQQ